MFWIDRSSETENVIVLTQAGILVGSCDEESCDSVQQQLGAGKTAIEVLGSGDILTIPYGQIQKVTSRDTDNDVSVEYKAKKDIEQKDLFFEDLDPKQQFVAALDKVMPENFVKSEVKQSALGAALNPMLSLLLSSAAIFLFINKFRWVTIIIGGLWALVSLYMLVSRIKSPPTVTRWTIGGRYIRKAWNGLKTATSYVIVAAVIALAHDTLPDSHGPSSIYEQMQFETLSPASIETLLGRGADIDYRDEYGDTALSVALDWGYYDVAIALVEAGADLTLRDSYDLTPLEYAISYDLDSSVINALLENGASLNFELEGMTPVEYAKEYEYLELEELLATHTGQ